VILDMSGAGCKSEVEKHIGSGLSGSTRIEGVGHKGHTSKSSILPRKKIARERDESYEKRNRHHKTQKTRWFRKRIRKKKMLKQAGHRDGKKNGGDFALRLKSGKASTKAKKGTFMGTGSKVKRMLWLGSPM